MEARADLSIKANENVSSIPVKTGDPDTKVRLGLFEVLPIRIRCFSWRDESWFWLTIDPWFLSPRTC